MDSHFSSRIQVSGPVHVNAAFYCPKPHVLGAVQNANQLPQNSLVQSLRNALISAVNDIKSLNEENKALKEQIGLLKDGSQVEVSQLQAELKEKDELLKRITKKRQARTKAHIDCLGLLAQKDMELKSSEEHWTKRCDALEESLQQEMAHREESWRRKVQEVEHERNLLCEEWQRKEESWRERESLTDEQITSKNELLLELVTNTKVQLENKIKKEEMKEEEEISREGQKGKDQENENKECDKMGNKPEMSDGKLKNEKKERKTKKKREKKRMSHG